MTLPSPHATEIFDDLETEDDRLEKILAGLSDSQWAASSAATGWTVRDVVVHLMQTDEAVVRSIEGLASPILEERPAGELDDAMARAVSGEEAPPEEIFERWRTARRAASGALRAADPSTPLPWATNALKPRVLATTRLAEHWAHALDITVPLGVPFPDTDRLRHIAWLAHRTLPYAYGWPARRLLTCSASSRVRKERCGPSARPRLTRGSGEWQASSVGSRPGVWPAASHLVAEGPHAEAALRHLRTYAA